MSSVNGTPSVKTETTEFLLSGQTVYLVPEHYDDLSTDIIARKIDDLGATVTNELSEATLIIVNDASPHWNLDAERSLVDQSRNSSADIRPYHWLSVCKQVGANVPLSDLPSESPFMVQVHTDHHPLKIWVSKNIERQAGETPLEAYQKVIDELESAGAILVVKRSHADVLIVDPASNFYATVVKEKEEAQRDWQKLAERDWVNFCLTNKICQLTTVRDEEEDDDVTDVSGTRETGDLNDDVDELDSMLDEGSPVGNGPGRPIRQPRVDYTPEDDEFLIRYLAYKFPHGAWLSRKTYQILMTDQSQYPQAARHTSQSWHERFRKTKVFKSRVERMLRQGLNSSLKTASERAKAAEKQAAQAPRDDAASRRASSTGGAGPSAAQSRQPSSAQPTVLVPETLVQPTVVSAHRAPPRRALVEDDPFTQSSEPEQAAKRDSKAGKRRQVEPVVETVGLVVAETEIQQAPDHTDSAPVNVTDTSTSIAGPSESRGNDDSHHEQAADPALLAAGNTTLAPLVEEVASEPHPKKRRKRQSFIEDIPAQPASALWGQAAPTRHETPSDGRESHDGRVPTGSTPLRQEIERSAEKRRRDRHRSSHGHGSTSRRLSKRAASPDKVYAYVNLPPPRPVVPQVQEVIPAPRSEVSRTPPRELTPAEREQSVVAGTRIVLDIAAQYRAKVAVLGKRFGVGIKEISAATNEVKRRSGGRNAVDWNVLEMVLQEQYGR